MKGRRAPILALLLALLLVLPGCEPLNQALAAPALDEDFSLSDIPAFSGQPYVVVGDNTPQFPEEDLVPAGTEAECAARAVALVRQGRGSLLIKGRLSTGALLGAVVDRADGIRGEGLLSHVAILEVPAYHKLLYITDGGLVVAPGLEEKRAILRNALSLCRFLGYERPKAAALCAAETVSPRMPETGDAAALREEGERGDFGPCLVEGPISLDLATSAEAARLKGYCSPVAGDADILLVPSIAAGNLLGKALYGLAGGKMAGVVLGASVPIALNSRGASWEEKYNSILICAAMSRR